MRNNFVNIFFCSKNYTLYNQCSTASTLKHNISTYRQFSTSKLEQQEPHTISSTPKYYFNAIFNCHTLYNISLFLLFLYVSNFLFVMRQRRNGRRSERPTCKLPAAQTESSDNMNRNEQNICMYVNTHIEIHLCAHMYILVFRTLATLATVVVVWWWWWHCL